MVMDTFEINKHVGNCYNPEDKQQKLTLRLLVRDRTSRFRNCTQVKNRLSSHGSVESDLGGLLRQWG